MSIIIDSGIFMNTSIISKFNQPIYTSPLVVDELKNQKTYNLFEVFKEQNNITIMSPSQEFIDKITTHANQLGQKELSKTDIEILALCLMFDNPMLITDDYDVRNVAHSLKIKSQGATTKGGSQLRKYKFKCIGCGKFYSNSIDECEICGTTKFNKFKK